MGIGDGSLETVCYILRTAIIITSVVITDFVVRNFVVTDRNKIGGKVICSRISEKISSDLLLLVFKYGML